MKMEISKGLFGLDKKQVEQYILDVEADYKAIIDSKENEIADLKKQIDDLNKKLEKYIEDEEKIKQEKEAIGSIFLKAQEQANQMIFETKDKFEKEKDSLEKIVEQEREKLLDTKKDISILKKAIVDTLEKYVKELEKLESTDVEKKSTRGRKPKKEQ